MTIEDFNKFLDGITEEQIKGVFNNSEVSTLRTQVETLTDTVANINTRVDSIKTEEQPKKTSKEVFDEYISSCHGLTKK